MSELRNTELYTEIFSVLTEAQVTKAVHPRCINKLKNTYKKSNPHDFFETLHIFLDRLLQEPINSKNQDFTRLISFIAYFSTNLQIVSEDDLFVEPEFLCNMLYYYLEALMNANDVIRYRACEMINAILNQLIGQQLSIDLYEYIQECMLERSYDSKSVIVKKVAISLSKLQDPENLYDPVIKRYSELMLHLNGDVRKAAITHIVPRNDVIPLLINRTRDINEEVRITAFERLSKLPKFLKIYEKQKILKNGIMDPSEEVRNKVIPQNLIPAWFEFYENDYLKFLDSLRLDADEDDIRNTCQIFDCVMNVLLSSRSRNEFLEVLKFDNGTLPIDQIACETVVYWYYFVSYVRQNDNYDDILQQILPQLPDFLEYVENIYCKMNDGKDLHSIEYCIILKFLFMIIHGYELNEVSSANCFKPFVSKTIKKVRLSLMVTETMMDCIKKAIENESERSLFVCEIISDMLRSVDEDKEIEKYEEIAMQISQFKVQLNICREDLDTAVKERDFKQAEIMNNKMDELKLSIETLQNSLKPTSCNDVDLSKLDTELLVKALEVSYVLLLSLEEDTMYAPLRTLKDVLIQPLLIHSDISVQCNAFKCYIICCLYDFQTAQIGMQVLSARILAYHTGMEYNIEFLTCAIAGVTKMLLKFGSKLVASPDDDGDTESLDEAHTSIFTGGICLTSIVRTFVDFMNDEDTSVQYSAVEALSSLIARGLLRSPMLLSRLLIKWFNNSNDNLDDSYGTLIQISLGRFFEMLPNLPNSQEQLQQSILPTLKILVNAPPTSPLAEVNITHIIKIMLNIFKFYQGDVLEIYGDIALLVCEEMLAKFKSNFIYAYSEVLLHLKLPLRSSLLNQIMELSKKLDRKTKKVIPLNKRITKFTTYVQSLLAQTPMETIEE